MLLLLSLIGLWKMWFLHAKSVQNLRKCHPFAHLCVNHEPPRRLHIGQRGELRDPQKLKDLRPLLCTLGPKPILHHKLVNIHLAHRLLMDCIIVHNVFMLQVLNLFLKIWLTCWGIFLLETILFTTFDSGFAFFYFLNKKAI